MRRDRCPHCKEFGFPVGRLPKEVIAVVACTFCGELAVLFRSKIIPLDKRTLESGTFEERKTHLAEVIAHFLESGLFNFAAPESFGPDHNEDEKPRRRHARFHEDAEESSIAPISDQEMDRFIKIDLKCLDNPAYFKRIFG